MASGNNASRRLLCKDLHAYLRSLPVSVLDKLYNHPATCLAVFRYVNLTAQNVLNNFLEMHTIFFSNKNWREAPWNLCTLNIVFLSADHTASFIYIFIL